MKVDLDNKLVSIFGLHETGKTHLAKEISGNYDTAVFDVLGEYSEKDFDIWKVQNDSYPEVQKEFDRFLDYLRDSKAEEEGDWEMLVCDESSTVHPNGKSMPSTMNNFLNYYRHKVEEKGWDMGGIFMARRPARVNTNIVELSRYLFIFRVTGKNDIRYLNDVSRQTFKREYIEENFNMNPSGSGEYVEIGLGSMASKLGSEGRPDHEFILVNPDRSFKVMNPI